MGAHVLSMWSIIQQVGWVFAHSEQQQQMMGLNNSLSLFAPRFWHGVAFASTFSDTWRIDNEEFSLVSF